MPGTFCMFVSPRRRKKRLQSQHVKNDAFPTGVLQICQTQSSQSSTFCLKSFIPWPVIEASSILPTLVSRSIWFSPLSLLTPVTPAFGFFIRPLPSISFSEHFFSLYNPRFWQPGGTRSAISKQFITCRMFWVQYPCSHLHHTQPLSIAPPRSPL